VPVLRACVLVAYAAATLTGAGYAYAQPPERPPDQAVAILRTGVVWSDDGLITLRGFGSGVTPLGTLSEGERWQVAASATAVALGGDASTAAHGREEVSAKFVGGVPPAPLRAIPEPRPVSGGGCSDWRPAAPYYAEFVVVDDELVASGRGSCPSGVNPVRRPLFVRNLRGGRWRVLRWLEGNSPPMLAAEGGRLAAGVQFSSATMEVVLINVRDDRTRARFDVPDGYLAFAAPNRILLAAPSEAHFPLGPKARVGSGADGGIGAYAGPFQLALYSTNGRRIAQLGSSPEVPLVSAMHIISEEEEHQHTVISLRGVLGGKSVPVVGYSEPERSLITLAFRWPALATVETTTRALAPPEITCESGRYAPPSPPFVTIFDLAKPEPFLAPPTGSSAGPGISLADCPPTVAIP
jgi:hypothetical protein